MELLRSLKRPAILSAMVTAILFVGREMLLEFVFGSAADWLRNHASVVGDFVNWRWSPLAVGLIIFLIVWVVADIEERKFPRSAKVAGVRPPELNGQPSRPKPRRAAVVQRDGPAVESQPEENRSRKTRKRQRVELTQWIYPRETVRVVCKVRRPDGGIDFGFAEPTVGLASTMRLIYPDDFHNAPLPAKGKYQVVWTLIGRRYDPPDPGTVSITLQGPYRRHEEVFGTSEFTIA